MGDGLLVQLLGGNLGRTQFERDPGQFLQVRVGAGGQQRPHFERRGPAHGLKGEIGVTERDVLRAQRLRECRLVVRLDPLPDRVSDLDGRGDRLCAGRVEVTDGLRGADDLLFARPGGLAASQKERFQARLLCAGER